MKKYIFITVLIAAFLVLSFFSGVMTERARCETANISDTILYRRTVFDVEASIIEYINSNFELLKSIRELDSVLLEIRKVGDEINILKTEVKK